MTITLNLWMVLYIASLAYSFYGLYIVFSLPQWPDGDVKYRGELVGAICSAFIPVWNIAMVAVMLNNIGKYDKLRAWWMTPTKPTNFSAPPTVRITPSFFQDSPDVQLRKAAEKLLSNFDNAGFMFDDEIEQLRDALNQTGVK